MDFAVIGLGNPGLRYAETRHNVGFQVIDRLAQRWNVSLWRQRFQSMMAEVEHGGKRVLLVRPLTYMNDSGSAVAQIVQDRGIDLQRLCVVYDDLHLPLGTLRVRRRGSDGGHRGLHSVIQKLGTEDFPRIRVGIGAPKGDQIEHVLSPFSEEERPVIREAIEKAADAVEIWLRHDIDEAMNRYNRRSSHEVHPQAHAESAIGDR